jgi:hypothetical protein
MLMCCGTANRFMHFDLKTKCSCPTLSQAGVIWVSIADLRAENQKPMISGTQNMRDKLMADMFSTKRFDYSQRNNSSL